MPRWSTSNLTEVERFWVRVQKTEACWIWTGRKNNCGYGRFWASGRECPAHGYSWSLVNGEMPHGKMTLHRCDNPACVRPDHLFIGTQTDNIRDMIAKKRRRHAVGEAMAHKLSQIDVRFIRENDGYRSQASLARQFGVHQCTISRIIGRKRWIYPEGVTHVADTIGSHAR